MQEEIKEFNPLGYKPVGKLLKSFLCLWGFLLAISILFVYQHHFIDFVGGTLIFLITCIIFPRKNRLLP